MSSKNNDNQVSHLTARAEPMIWLTGGALVICLLLVAGLLIWITGEGLSTFVVRDVEKITTKDGKVYIGEVTREETFKPSADADPVLRRQVRTGNYDLSDSHFDWVRQDEVESVERPEWATVVERLEWGRLYGHPVAIASLEFLDQPVRGAQRGQLAERLRAPTADPNQVRQVLALRNVDGAKVNPRKFLLDPDEVRDSDRIAAIADVIQGPEAVWRRFEEVHAAQRDLHHQIKALEEHEVGAISKERTDLLVAIETARRECGVSRSWRDAYLELRRSTPIEERLSLASRLEKVEARSGKPSEEFLRRLAEIERQDLRAVARTEELTGQIRTLKQRMERQQIAFNIGQTDAEGADIVAVEVVAEIVRAYQPNREAGGAGVYASRWSEYLFDDPREANAEGGVFPAIFGTVLMTLLMCIAVVPLGVLAALYLHEYAKKGFIISTVRIAVNNLAGVPSIVFGVFGLGFFCYFVGAEIDELLFKDELEILAKPTFGTGGIFWASLTLALMTLPVVIVSTEEALAAVPNSMRDGSYACGATKWQTIRRIVLPHALPGIMTGAILAMARGAGEVAPLMLVGAVKLAPSLPISGDAPFGLNQSFMHLGFHIFDLGFQSQNSEASKPMVFTTTFLLITIVAVLNVTAIWLRSRLRRRFQSSHF